MYLESNLQESFFVTRKIELVICTQNFMSARHIVIYYVFRYQPFLATNKI